MHLMAVQKGRRWEHHAVDQWEQCLVLSLALRKAHLKVANWVERTEHQMAVTRDQRWDVMTDQ